MSKGFKQASDSLDRDLKREEHTVSPEPITETSNATPKLKFGKGFNIPSSEIDASSSNAKKIEPTLANQTEADDKINTSSEPMYSTENTHAALEWSKPPENIYAPKTPSENAIPSYSYADPPTGYPKKKRKTGLIVGTAAALLCVAAVIAGVILRVFPSPKPTGSDFTAVAPNNNNSTNADNGSTVQNNNDNGYNSETNSQTGVALSDEVFSMYPSYTCQMNKYDAGINGFEFSVPAGSYKYDIPSGNENVFESSFIVALYDGSQVIYNISSLTLDEIKNYQNSESGVAGTVIYGKRDELNKIFFDNFNSTYAEPYLSEEEALADIVEDGDFENPSTALSNIDMIDVYLMDLLADGTSVYDTESILIADDGQPHSVNEEYLNEKWSNDGKTMSIETESFSYDTSGELISSESDIVLIKRIDEGEYVKLFIGAASSWPISQTEAVSQLEYTAKYFN